MFTSCFPKVKEIIAAGLEPVCIARGAPKGYTGRRELRLAPTWAMLKLDKTGYDAAFNAILAQLDPAEIYASLGDKAVLLCWEKPNHEACHRRIVAEFFEKALGVEVAEFGFPRGETPCYHDVPWKAKAIKTLAS